MRLDNRALTVSGGVQIDASPRQLLSVPWWVDAIAGGPAARRKEFGVQAAGNANPACVPVQDGLTIDHQA